MAASTIADFLRRFFGSGPGAADAAGGGAGGVGGGASAGTTASSDEALFRSVVADGPPASTRSAAANAAGLAARVASSLRLAGAVRSLPSAGTSSGAPLSGTIEAPLPVTASLAANSWGSDTTRVGSFDASSATEI